MEKHKIDKINELAHKSKTCGLTEEEKALQRALRKEYVESFRQSLVNTLDNTYIVRPDGTKEKLKRKQ